MTGERIPAALGPGPFTVAAARKAGLSAQELRGRRFVAPHHGVRMVAGGAPDERQRVEAAKLVLPPNTLATGVTGLRLFGIDVAESEPLRFVTSHPSQVRRPGVRVTRVATLPPAWDELVAEPAHCWMTACLELNLLDQVIAGDWLLRLRLSNLRPLADYVAASRSRGSGAARRAAGWLRERVDSPRESWLRMCLVLAGLPVPDCNPTIRAGGLLARVDLVYRDFRVLIEYEGDQHRTDRAQWNVDMDRQDAFIRDGWALHRVTAGRARQPRELVARVHALLVAGGYRGAGPVFTPTWLSLFE